MEKKIYQAPETVKLTQQSYLIMADLNGVSVTGGQGSTLPSGSDVSDGDFARGGLWENSKSKDVWAGWDD